MQITMCARRENETNLNYAFRLMRKNKLVARQNYYCCSNCAGCAIANDITASIEASKKTKEDYAGACFYHKQEGERKKHGQPFYLHYGSVGTSKYGDIGLPDTEVGHLVAECLTAASVEYDWNGSSDACIQVMRW